MTAVGEAARQPRRLAEIRADLAAAGLPAALDDSLGELVAALIAARPGGVALQLGSGSAEITAWLVAGLNATSRVITVVEDPRAEAVVRRHLGDDIRLTVHVQASLDFLADVRRHRMDLVVSDGDAVLALSAVELLAPGGMLLAWDGVSARPRVAIESALRAERAFRVVRLTAGGECVLAVRRPVDAIPMRRGGRSGRTTMQ